MRGILKYFVAIVVIVLSISLEQQIAEAFVYRLITETLQNNVAGEPVTHLRTNWDFDPDVAIKRRALFYEKNGYRAERFIESLGLGIDGKHEERRFQQAIRDQGRLNGEHFHNYQ